MRSFLVVCACAVVASSLLAAAPVEVADAEAPDEAPKMDTLADIRARAVSYHVDPSCTFVNVELERGGEVHKVRVGLDGVRGSPWARTFGSGDSED